MKLLQSISLFTFLALSSVAIHPTYAHGDDHKDGQHKESSEKDEGKDHKHEKGDDHNHSHDKKNDESKPAKN